MRIAISLEDVRKRPLLFIMFICRLYIIMQGFPGLIFMNFWIGIRPVFLTGIGGALRSGQMHDGRAPDYDDWSLNGDILLYDPLLDIALEVSSMGIRVDPDALRRQLAIRGCEERAELPFQKALLNGELPQTMGGGIGQSRMCVYLLRKAHVGEVQASLWPLDVQDACRKANIQLL